MFFSQGIDTVSVVGNYEVLKNILKRENRELSTVKSNTPLTPYIKSIEKSLKLDNKTRYKKEGCKLSFEYVKIAKGRGLSSYMLVIQNTSFLFDYATENKKKKDFYCMVVFTGLHQPSKNIHNDSIKYISNFLKRKSFKTFNIDIATDYQEKKQTKQEYNKNYKGFYNYKDSSIYYNQVSIKNIDKVIIYDKYKKQKTYHKQNIPIEFSNWKRLEIKYRPKKNEKLQNFYNVIQSEEFFITLDEVEKINSNFKVEEINSDYLIYQLNSLLDKRIINNKESKKQFNSREALERFKSSEFRRFTMF